MSTYPTFPSKWRDLLPISRRCTDEERIYKEIKDLQRERDRLIDLNDELTRLHDEVAAEFDAAGSELKELAVVARRLEETHRSDSEELEKLVAQARHLEASPAPPEEERDSCDVIREETPGRIGPDSGLMKKFKYYMKTEGPTATVGRSISYAKRRSHLYG